MRTTSAHIKLFYARYRDYSTIGIKSKCVCVIEWAHETRQENRPSAVTLIRTTSVQTSWTYCLKAEIYLKFAKFKNSAHPQWRWRYRWRVQEPTWQRLCRFRVAPSSWNANPKKLNLIQWALQPRSHRFEYERCQMYGLLLWQSLQTTAIANTLHRALVCTFFHHNYSTVTERSWQHTCSSSTWAQTHLGSSLWPDSRRQHSPSGCFVWRRNFSQCRHSWF